MAKPKVSDCVQLILESFASAAHVCKKISKKRPKRTNVKTRKANATDDGERILLSSLRQGPTSIGHEYQQSFQAVGKHFAVGDAVAHAALAEVLFKLNVSLVAIINQFLQREKVLLDFAFLTGTSEKACKDTCHALNQLYSRLLHQPSSKQLHGVSHGDADHWKKKQHRTTSGKGLRSRRPILAKVFIADSAKPAGIAMVKPGARSQQKKPYPSSGSGSTSQQSKSSQMISSSRLEKTGVEHQHLPVSQEIPTPRSNLSALKTGQLHPSDPQSDSTRRGQPARRQVHLQGTPSMLLLHPGSSAPPTYCSTECNSTKLGEIPLHKWSEPPDFEAMSLQDKEAMKNGWPLSNVQVEPPKSKTISRFFRLFRCKKPNRCP